MHQPDQDDAPANVQIVGLQVDRDSIAGMLRRLSAERLVERLWSRDPTLWYPAAETQARILERLGWLDLPIDSEADADCLTTLRSRGIDHLLYVGTSDANMIARLWRDLAAQPDSARLTVLDSIDPSAVQSTLAALDWQRTAILLAADSTLTPDLDALTRIVLAARAQAAPSNTSPLAVVAPPHRVPSGHGSRPLLSLVQSYDEPALVPLPPDLGARFGPLSPLGLLPAEWLGWSIDRLRSSALEMRAQCRRDDLSRNPGVWLGTALAVLAQSGRDKLTLLASPELLPLARWIATFISGSLSKHGRGFVTDVEEPRTGCPLGDLEPRREQRTREQTNKRTNEQGGTSAPLLLPQPRRKPAEVWGKGWGDEGQGHDNEQENKGTKQYHIFPSPIAMGEGNARRARGEGLTQHRPPPIHDRIIMALRLSGGKNSDLDQELAAFATADLPIVTLELADRYAVAGQILMWQIAVATIGVVIGLNPFDEPDTAARDAYLWRRLQSGASRWLPLATPLEPKPLAEAWQLLSPTIASTRYIAIVNYLPASTVVSEQLAELRTLLARRFGVTVVVLDPLREQAVATQVLHAGRPCAILLLTADAAATVAVPGRGWTLDDLRRERIAADLLAWTQLGRRFVHLDLGSDPAHGLRRCLDLLAALEP